MGLVAITLAVYAQVIRHQFIYLDDMPYIRDNRMVNRGLTLGGIVWAFTTFYAANWHPLTWIAHMIDCQLFGLNPGAHLFVQVLIHSANAALVFWFLRQATGGPGRAGRIWPSAIVAALFALHPLHVESVAWAAERKDTLSTFFGLLSLIAYVRYAESPSWKRYLLVAVLLALGLMAKPMLVTWPFVMLLLDYWPLGRFQRSEVSGPWSVVRSLVIEKIPLFVLAGLSSVMTFVAQSRGGAVRAFVDMPVSVRLANAIVACAKYLWHTFWPHHLAFYYPYANVNVWHVLLAAVILITISALCLSQRRRRPFLIVGWLWFLGTLVPVIGIVQVGGQSMADRYYYIPSIGLFTALVFGVADVVSRRRSLCLGAPAATGIALVALAGLTFRQIQLWRDTFTLFEHSLRIAPGSLAIEYNLGLAFSDIGKNEEAVEHLEKALALDPNFALALYSMGLTRAKQGRFTEAIPFYEHAIRSEPKLPPAHAGLGMALAAQGKTESATKELREAARLDPEDADVRTNLGLLLAQRGQVSEGIDTLHDALRLNPNSAEAHNNLGTILFTTGKTRESIAEFEAAVRLNPSLEKASENLRQAEAKLAAER